MNIKKSFKLAWLPLFCAIFFAGCSSTTSPAPEEPAGVQDITPGEKSIIQAPSPSSRTEPVIEEKNI